MSSAPRLVVPSSLNCTPETPTLSDALADTVTEEPETVVPFAGAVTETVGAWVSGAPTVIGWESLLLVSSDSAKRLTSSANAVIVWVPLGMMYGPPLVPMVTEAPAASGPDTPPQVLYTPSTE